MEIIIHDSLKLSEIQKDFNVRFPYLKIEFFDFAPGEKRVFSKKHLITDTEQTLGEVRHVHYSGHLNINGHQKTGTVEKNFSDLFGVYIQIFRKSGNNWLETSTTDDRTLSEQNRKGEEMNKAVEEQVTSDFDHYKEQL